MVTIALRGKPETLGPRSVLVIPLQPIGDTSLHAVAAALTEEVTTALAQDTSLMVQTMSVAGSTSVRAGDVRETAAALGVTNVIEGRLQRIANRLRFTMGLVRATDGVALLRGRRFRFSPRSAVPSRLGAPAERKLRHAGFRYAVLPNDAGT